ncbi:MAG: Branched-chain amino acid ABC-type transport system, permease component [Ilumatobacteraceae bacterium]|nr:Branched-chain amino acid ABC-type transport system, permease component [Ilumatobacteraceae bacterium]
MFVALAGALWSPSAHAEDTIIKVRVQNTPVGGGKKVPVEGVAVTVADSTGAQLDTGTTDAKGIAELTVPSGGDFTVQIDAATLPDGLGLPAGDTGERIVTATEGLGGNANYNLGQAVEKGKSKLDLLPQAMLNGVRFGLVIAIMSVGLSLIYATTGLSNFAHAETVTMGAVVTWSIDDHLRIFHSTTGVTAALQLIFVSLFGIAATALFSGGLELGVWRPMRRKRIGLTSMMIVSIGIAIFVRFFIQFRFGDQPKSYREFSSQRNLSWLPATPRDLLAAGISLVCLGGVAYMLMRTRTGKAIRAVSDNPELSSSTGINTDRIILFVWVLGGALAGLSGVLFGLDEQVQWNMGSRLLLLMFAAITLGGLGRPFGALVGSLVVGMMVQLWAWFFSGYADLKNVGALLALILILLVRPQGILGKKERVG